MIAKSLDIPLLIQHQYGTMDYENFLRNFKKLDIDLLLSNSYSMKIRGDILKSINYNAVNVHWSLLPKNRGPNPIQWALIKGEEKTGVTIHYVDDNIDTGDIIAQKEVVITLDDTWVTLKKKLENNSNEIISEIIPAILDGINKRIPQINSESSLNQRLTSDSPRIDFGTMSDREIFNLIRAQVKPLKGAYIYHNGGRKYFSEFISFEKVSELRKEYVG